MNDKTQKNLHSRQIVLFYVVTALYWFSLYAYVPMLGTYAQDLKASLSLAGIISGSYGFMQMVCRIPLGIASDMMKKQKLFVVLGIVVAIISALGVFVFPNRYSLLVFRSLSGVAASAWVVFTILFASYFREDEAMKSIGLLNSSNAVGIVASMFFGGAVANAWGDRYAFLLAAAVGVIALVMSLFVGENSEMSKKPVKLREAFGVAVSEKQLMRVSVLAIIAQFMMFATTYGFATTVARDLGADNFQLGLLSAVALVPGFFIAQLASTTLLRKFGARSVIAVGFFIAALACIAIPYSPNLPVLFISQFIGGIGRNAVFPLLMGLSIQDVSSEKRATAMGFFQAIYSFGMFVGPTLTGFIGDGWGMTAAFVITGAVGFAGIIMTWFFIRRRR